jgi:predicted metal-dependent hydrolase
MDINLIFLMIILICASVAIFFKFSHPGMIYIKSNIDGSYYLVRNVPDKQEASNTLARIRQNIINLSDYLYFNINDVKIKKYKKYIIRLQQRVRDIVILESEHDSIYTSYSVNKGEQIIFCLRSRKTPENLHDLNLMMYVVLHEISHVACPIYDNHGPLFREIFSFITTTAVNMGLYKKIDFATNNTEYCGLNITDSII